MVALGLLALPATLATEVRAQAPTVDPAATKILQRMTEYAALPAGCVPTPIGGVEYYRCGANYYRAAFQGNTLVYVTTQPK
jgi:hypothetical protein